MHRAGGGLTYGELAAEAAKMPVPANVTLKSPERLQADRHAGQAARCARQRSTAPRSMASMPARPA